MLHDQCDDNIKVDSLFKLRTNVFLFSPELCIKDVLSARQVADTDVHRSDITTARKQKTYLR